MAVTETKTKRAAGGTAPEAKAKGKQAAPFTLHEQALWGRGLRGYAAPRVDWFPGARPGDTVFAEATATDPHKTDGRWFVAHLVSGAILVRRVKRWGERRVAFETRREGTHKIVSIDRIAELHRVFAVVFKS